MITRLAAIVVLSSSSVMLQAQAQKPSAPGLRATEKFRLTAEQGGPERPGVLAVSNSGSVAFTFGTDDGGRHVTLVDSSGRLRARFGGPGSGPGEFQSVLALFVEESRVVLFGLGQLSAFAPSGRHLWSRALAPTQLPVALHADSVDLMDATYFHSGLGVGDIRRRSTARGGGDRLLIAGNAAFVRDLARSASDSARFMRLAYAATSTDLVIGNGYSFRMLHLNAKAAVQHDFGPRRPALRPTKAEVDAEVARQVALASRPFKLPDGSTRRNPVRMEQIRARASAPRAYFSARLGGLHIDPGTGDVFTVETHRDSVRVTRFKLSGASSGSVSIACDARDGSAALQWPFLALTCAGADGPGAIELRLFRLTPTGVHTTSPPNSRP